MRASVFGKLAGMAVIAGLIVAGSCQDVTAPPDAPDAPSTVIINCWSLPLRVEIEVRPWDGGAVMCQVNYKDSTEVTVTATASSAGCAFIGWKDELINNRPSSSPYLYDSARTVLLGFGGGRWDHRTYRMVAHFNCNFNPDVIYDSFTDSRDGRVYRTVQIGTQIWMAENLNWAGEDGGLGLCYSDCGNHGRLYDWSTVMDFTSLCNDNSCVFLVQSPHRGICPEGWHVPSSAEWDTLVNFAGGSSAAGTSLRALTGWGLGHVIIPGTNDFGFSALPGGFCENAGTNAGCYNTRGGSFAHGGVLRGGYWWSSSEWEWDASGWYVNGLSMVNSSDYISIEEFWKTNGLSLRCVRTED